MGQGEGFVKAHDVRIAANKNRVNVFLHRFHHATLLLNRARYQYLAHRGEDRNRPAVLANRAKQALDFVFKAPPAEGIELDNDGVVRPAQKFRGRVAPSAPNYLDVAFLVGIDEAAGVVVVQQWRQSQIAKFWVHQACPATESALNQIDFRVPQQLTDDAQTAG